MSAQGAINVRNKVSDLQSKLSHAAKQSLDRKFGALYDKIYREDVILEAWKRIMAFRQIDETDKRFVRDRLRIFLKRKYSDQSRGTRRVHGNLLVRLELYQFG